jgi:exosome complex component CSL4
MTKIGLFMIFIDLNWFINSSLIIYMFMSEERKLVLPGDHIGGAMEVVPGANAYEENDEVYSSAAGELVENDREVAVKAKPKARAPEVGMDLYCVVRKISATKAFLDCVPAADLDKKGSAIDISAVLPVANIKRERVREVRDELRVGDIIKAKIHKITRDDVDVSIYGDEYGVVKAFCSFCRKGMVLNGKELICNNCESREHRKLSEEYPLGV